MGMYSGLPGLFEGSVPPQDAIHVEFKPNVEVVEEPPAILSVDLTDVALDDVNLLSHTIVFVRSLVRLGYTVHLVGPTHNLLHVLYKVGDWPHPRLHAHDVRDLEAYE